MKLQLPNEISAWINGKHHRNIYLFNFSLAISISAAWDVVQWSKLDMIRAPIHGWKVDENLSNQLAEKIESHARYQQRAISIQVPHLNKFRDIAYVY